MFSHHVVTILLLLGSYTSHFTPIGNVVLVLMDPCDVLLSVSFVQTDFTSVPLTFLPRLPSVFATSGRRLFATFALDSF